MKENDGKEKKNNIIIICIIALLVIMFVIVALCIKTGKISNFESNVYNMITANMNDVTTNILKVITHIGSSISVISICLIISIITRKANIILPLGASVLGSAFVNQVLKHLFERPRPEILRLVAETGYSFPSRTCYVKQFVILDDYFAFMEIYKKQKGKYCNYYIK